jgi:hypothetical protein
MGDADSAASLPRAKASIRGSRPGIRLPSRYETDAVRMLISPAEYASAEVVCDSIWWLARESGVTVGMIVAYWL